jgi:lycopene cyclase domain-containing protein
VLANRFEYLFLLLVWAAAGVSILWTHIRPLLRARHFWISSLIFMSLGTVVDLIAISQSWWHWSPLRTCGLAVAAIPIEEYIGFFIGHLLAVAAWETLDDLA